ncbi:MAG: hypothetical protein WCO96_05330 [Actinomycetes bacterium]
MADPSAEDLGGSFTRRSLIGAGASLGAASLLSACGEGGTASTAPGEPIDAAAAGMPYRQDDPRWGSDLMWDRDLVIEAETKLNGRPRAEAEGLMREFDDGNNIANEGCLLTCLAMVLRLLDPGQRPEWNPGNLNRAAQEAYFYTLSGLAMEPLYADLVAEASEGLVQLLAQELYLPGVEPWRPVEPADSALVRAYRTLTPGQRGTCLVMVKTGTWDDTVGSHYALLDPADRSDPGADDALILDPAEPLGRRGPWRLSDSAKAITQDPEIAAAWKENRITPTRIGGAWAFSRWDRTRAMPLASPLVAEWAKQLSS